MGRENGLPPLPRQPAMGSIGKESVSIRVGPDDTHRIGEKVDVYFQPNMASVFDEESGDRL